MLLRASGEHDGLEHDFDIINGQALDRSPLADTALLNEFAESFAQSDGEALGTARTALVETLGAEALVDCAATVAIFDAVVRIADASGIPLEAYKVDGAKDLRDQLGIDDFRHQPRA